jgi:chromosomal replication initiator protein
VKANWEAALSAIRRQVTSDSFERFFGRLSYAGFESGVLRLTVDDAFLRDWIDDNYRSLLEAQVAEIVGEPARIELGVAVPPPAEIAAPAPGGRQPPPRSRSPPACKPRSRSDPDFPEFPLNPQYTFDTFVVGPSNQFVHAACESVANNPAAPTTRSSSTVEPASARRTCSSPSPTRCGLAIPGARINYVSAEEFTNQLIKGISGKGMEAFRERYRSRSDVLLMDDVHNLAGKERTQEEFFHTFNALHQSSKQIILTSDKVPQDIPKLEERLRSRFTWGLIADIMPPELETRVAILDQKAHRDGFELPTDVGFLLASRVRSNVRELEGALTRVIAYCSLTRRPLTLALAAEALKHVLTDADKGPSMETILRIVAEHFDVKVADLRGPRRHRTIAHPRSVAMYLCRKHAQASFPQIGESFGGKDHTTVIHACKKIEAAAASDAALRALIQSIERKLPA